MTDGLVAVERGRVIRFQVTIASLMSGDQEQHMMRRTLILASFFCFVAPIFALAGEKLEVQTFDPTGARQETGRIYIEDGNFFRFDPEVNAQGVPKDNSIIFRADTGTFVVLDPDEEDYLVLDKGRLRSFSTELKRQLQEMRQRLDEMPPAQRQMMEKILKAESPPGTLQFALDIRKIGPDDGATKYEVRVNGKKTTAVWTKPLDVMGLDPSALELIRKMSAFYDTVMESLSTDLPLITFGDNPFAGIGEMDGFPSKIEDLATGEVTRIGAAETLELDMALFAPPPDYTERTLQPE